MLKRVTIIANTFDPDTWESFEVPHVGEFLTTQFDTFPETARVYCGHVSEMTDITPHDEASIARLEEIEGEILVMVFPAEPITILYAVVAVLVVAVVVIATQGVPPNPTLRNTQAQSANNELSERKNQPRPNGRIPDIYGTVRATPDLLSVPYVVFENNQELEYCYMCVGRGEYTIPRETVRDDVTPAIDVPGMAVEIYGPLTSPNSGLPQLTIGDPIDTRLLNPVRSNSVNGQVLRAPNDQAVVGNNDIKFTAPNQIQANPDSKIDFTGQFDAGSQIKIANAIKYTATKTYSRSIKPDSGGFSYNSPVNPITELIIPGKTLQLVGATFTLSGGSGGGISVRTLSGTYSVETVTVTTDPVSGYLVYVKLLNPGSTNPQWNGLTGASAHDVNIIVPDGSELLNLDGVFTASIVTAKTIFLNNPDAVNPNWLSFAPTEYMSPVLSVSSEKWIGPFVLPGSSIDEIYCNFVAPNGVYKDDGKVQELLVVTVVVEITPVDVSGNPSGSPESYEITVTGSGANRDLRGTTAYITPVNKAGRYKVRARRITDADYAFEGQVVDEIKWRDAYAMTSVAADNFGNVTTVQTKTRATTGALAIKERKLNMISTRNIPIRISGDQFTITKYPTNNPADIFSAISLDPRIGNRDKSEIDFDSIYNAYVQANGYFGSAKALQFNYTLDSTNLSYEETARMIADVMFCTAYRRGNIIRFNFERKTENSTLLFNHANKIPNTETRTTRFGNQDNYDGVSYSYVDPIDDAIVTYYIPEDRSAINPKEIESVGVRSKLQARFLAYREWNRIQYGNRMAEFTATQEASLLVNRDRIIIADGTRPESQDGEIIEQFGLNVTLSRKVSLPSDPYLFVQHTDGTSESIPVLSQLSDTVIVLKTVPRRPLATAPDLFARATFILVGNTEKGQNTYLVTERRPNDNLTSTVTAVNYDDRYYQNDFDFINGVVDDNGEYL